MCFSEVGERHEKIKHCLSAKASRVSMQTDKQDGKCLTESSNKVVLAYMRPHNSICGR